MREKIRGWSLARKINVVCTITLVLPMTVMSILLITQMNNTLYRGQRNAQQEYVRAVADGINEKALLVEECSWYLVNLPILSDYTRRNFHFTATKVLDLLNSVYPSIDMTQSMHQDIIHSITVYTKNPTHPEVGKIFQNESHISDPEILEFLEQPDQIAKWFHGKEDPAARFTQSGTTTLPPVHMHARKLYSLNRQRVGLIVVTSQEDQLFSSLNAWPDHPGKLILHPSELTEYDANSVYQEIPRLGLQIGASVERTDLRGQIAINIFGILAAMLLGVLALSYFVRVMVRNVLRRVNLTVEAMAYVAHGNFDARIRDDQQDEIGAVIVQFNKLLDLLENTIRQKIENERQKRDAQLAALQYQINPHFIYNSLYMLQLSVEKKELYDTANAISWFASILRYNIGGTMFATFSEEIENLEIYIKFINTFRLKAIRLEVDLPQSLKDRKFLRFIFQPVVENAVKYGGQATSLIRITIRQSVDQCFVDFQNDGDVISDEAIREANRTIRESPHDDKFSKGIGLRNIARRLSIFYRIQAGIYLTNTGFTCVHIYFPNMEAEPDEDQYIDRG